jgi:hypothetical protein
MTNEKIQQHIEFLKKILENVSGQTNTYRNGKNKAIRDAADSKLENACLDVERYLQRNSDLFDFMVKHHSCAPEYLEYPKWDHIEGDTRDYIKALNDKLI